MGKYGKNQNAGPYCANGYRHNSNASHLNFVEGEDVFYIGNRKSKKLTKGQKGVVMPKTKQDRSKTNRSLIKVDFSESGVRFVSKQLLQSPSDYTFCLQDQLSRCQSGKQAQRNDRKKTIQSQLRQTNYEQTLANRAERKRFREWRKEYLDLLESRLESDYATKKQCQEVKDNRVREADVKKQIRQIKEKDDLTDEDKSLLESYQSEIKEISQFEKAHYKELNVLKEMIHNKASRKFVRCVYSRPSYNDYLHSIRLNDTYPKIRKPSRDYTVNESKEVSDNSIQRFQWGLS